MIGSGLCVLGLGELVENVEQLLAALQREFCSAAQRGAEFLLPVRRHGIRQRDDAQADIEFEGLGRAAVLPLKNLFRLSRPRCRRRRTCCARNLELTRR